MRIGETYSDFEFGEGAEMFRIIHLILITAVTLIMSIAMLPMLVIGWVLGLFVDGGVKANDSLEKNLGKSYTKPRAWLWSLIKIALCMVAASALLYACVTGGGGDNCSGLTSRYCDY